MADSNISADVLIVGGGSAGAVLAARLSEDSSRTVLLLEAGPAYALDEIPSGLLDANHVADPEHDWGYTARANDHQLGVPTPRGKALGGSSSVNAAVAIRARPSDLAKWASHGAEGWSYDEVLPTYRNMENTPTGDDLYHGRSGPLSIRQRSNDELTPSLRGFIEAGSRRATRKCTTSTARTRTGLVDIRLTSSTGSARARRSRTSHPRCAGGRTSPSKVVSTWTACCSTARRRSASSPTTARNTERPR